MTKLEAIAFFMDMDECTYGGSEPIQMAIEALKHEPCEDAKPYEKFKSAKDHICKLAGDYKCWDNRLTHDEALELCKALEQDSILDKIKAEIEQTEINGHIRDIECFRAGINVTLNIIDKYKAETESEE